MGTTEGRTSVKSRDGTIVSTGGLITGVTVGLITGVTVGLITGVTEGLITGVTGGLAIRVAVGVGLTGTVAGDTPRVVVVVVATMVGVKSGSTE